MRQAIFSQLFTIFLYLAIFTIQITSATEASFTLHAKKGFRGDSVYVDLLGCQNLHAFNKKVSSVTVKENSCIRLHNEFGCQGRHLDLEFGKLDPSCAENLATCGWNDATSSVSSCDYKLTRKEVDDNSSSDIASTTTTRGEICKTPCSMEKDTHYFWCYTDARRRAWDYCSPLVGVDYYGNVCSEPCSHRSYSYSWCPCKKCRYTARRQGWKESWGYCSLK